MTKKDEKDKKVTEATAKQDAQECCCENSNNEMDCACQEEMDALKAQLADAEQKAQENLDGWQRAIAEFSNYRKRIERDRVQNQLEASSSIIKKVLPILDDLDRSLANRPEKGEGAEWAKGIELVQRKMMTLLENENVVEIQAENAMFDPNFHEAIAMEPSEAHESGQIIEVLQKGYLIGERVLRPTLVRVAD
jgi:molecular chaperone GrpE